MPSTIPLVTHCILALTRVEMHHLEKLIFCIVIYFDISQLAILILDLWILELFKNPYNYSITF